MYVRGRFDTLFCWNQCAEFKNISRVKISRNSIQKVAKTFVSSGRQAIYDGRIELDTHADTFVAGRNCLLMHYTERVCDVMPYSDEYEARKGVPIVQVATGHTAANGQRTILIFNETLWMPEMQHSLMNPNQLRHFGVNVQDNPYHSSPMMINKNTNDEEFVACLQSAGTNIFLDTWTPSERDLQDYPHVVLTSDKLWDPHSVNFPSISKMETEELEGRNISSVGHDLRRESMDISFCDPYHQSMKIFDIQVFNARIIQSTKIHTKISNGPLPKDQIMPTKTFISSERHSNTTAEDLSEIWNISVEQARMTLDATTQYHVRSAIMPLSRRYRTDRMFEPKRIKGIMASDTMDPRCDSMYGDYRYAQVFGNKQMFCEAYPIVSKADCDQALKRFIIEYGAPDVMVTDGSPEQTGRNAKFQSTLRKNKVRSSVTNRYSPNQNPVETVIRELRKRWYRAIFRTNCPKSIWAYGIPHFAKLMQLTASNAARLEGRTPLGALTGETPDISQYLDFGWYDWVWFKENAGLDVPRLG